MTARMTVLLLLVSASMPAFAQGSQRDAAIQTVRTYCKADIERLCPYVEPGSGGVQACLKQHRQEISVGCAQALQQLRQSRQ
ncbi:MAG: cysteine rich repeat-containing protein [Candidatus Competibacter sp.]|nr:cysteine rich repeat-containing protein [Candidatus Competibacter sp.]